MTDYTSNPVKDADNEDRDREENQGNLDRQVEDYKEFHLFRGMEMIYYQNRQPESKYVFIQHFRDWADQLDDEEINDFRLAFIDQGELSPSDTVCNSFLEYTDRVAEIAVRDRNKL